MTASKLSFRKKIALNLFRQYKLNESKLHQLNYILWECTLRCNLNCIHCDSDCKKNSTVKDMPKEDFFTAINQIKTIVNPNKTMIVLTGGEPLLRNDLESIGFELYKNGFPWGMVTNGFLLNKERLENLTNSGLRSLTISLDGLEDSHNWLRGSKESFKKVIRSIELLKNNVEIIYDVVTCVNQNNFKDLENLKSLLIDKGVKDWRIFTIFPIGRAKENIELQLDSSHFKKLFDFIKESRKDKRIKISYGCEGFLGSYEGEVRENFFICRAGINIASILANGSISACPNIRDNFIQGNIYKDNFAEIWENKYEIFRNRNWAKTGICKECNFFRYCEGNGMHLRDEKTGDLLFCHLKRLEEGENATN
ncbi:MAG: radical SAM/SPASM domain-containing protein [Bacteroidetes bacterium HGW-Bacteroidetes-21]|nr:MAG: radical SAM/SPASM domain-containing protein [Bacteroidetes bacterium HGW-Bacteroidetes-21]